MTNEQFVHQAECQPCACGKRQTAEPQILESEVQQSECDSFDGFKFIKFSAHLRCGICQQSHKMACLEGVE